MQNNLNPNREYYIDEKGQIRRGKQPHLLALYNQEVHYAMGYCDLKQCYLTPQNVSEKQCLIKGYKYHHCKHFIHLSGKECKHGLKGLKQKRWKDGK